MHDKSFGSYPRVKGKRPLFHTIISRKHYNSEFILYPRVFSPFYWHCYSFAFRGKQKAGKRLRGEKSGWRREGFRWGVEADAAYPLPSLQNKGPNWLVRDKSAFLTKDQTNEIYLRCAFLSGENTAKYERDKSSNWKLVRCDNHTELMQLPQLSQNSDCCAIGEFFAPYANELIWYSLPTIEKTTKCLHHSIWNMICVFHRQNHCTA